MLISKTCRLAPARPRITYLTELRLATLVTGVARLVAIVGEIARVVLAALAAALLAPAALLRARLSLAVVVLRMLLATLLAALILAALILATLILTTLLLVRHKTLATENSTQSR
jgi:hypothetical protein